MNPEAYDDQVVTLVPEQAEKLLNQQPCRLFWIKISDLKVGAWKQKPSPKAKYFQKMVEEFDEKRLGPIRVNQREDLSLWCYDGGIRLAAAAKAMGPNAEVLCAVHVGGDVL
jgi:hypothetical protein